MKVVILDTHRYYDYGDYDSRFRFAADQSTIQSLTANMGTGGGNVPLVLIVKEDGDKHPYKED